MLPVCTEANIIAVISAQCSLHKRIFCSSCNLDIIQLSGAHTQQTAARNTISALEHGITVSCWQSGISQQDITTCDCFSCKRWKTWKCTYMTNAGEECISMITGASTSTANQKCSLFSFLTSVQERKKKNIWCLESDNINLTVSCLKATDCAHCCDWSPSLKLILELTPLSQGREMLLFDGDRGNVRLSSASALQNLRKALMCTQSYFDLLILTHLQQARNKSE